MCLLAGISYPLVDILLGEKWNFAAILIIPLCFNMMWYPIHAINLNLLQVKGRSDLFLRLEIIKKCIGVVFLLSSIPFGVIVMCYVSIAQSLVALVINTYYTGKLIDTGFLLQIKDVSTSFLLSFTMFLVVFGLTLFLPGSLFKLVFGVIIGCAFFVVFAMLLKMKEIAYIKELVKK